MILTLVFFVSIFPLTGIQPNKPRHAYGYSKK